MSIPGYPDKRHGSIIESTAVSGQPAQAVVNPDGSTISGGGGGGLTVVDDVAFTAGTSPFTPIGGQYDSSAQTIVSGQQAMVAIDAVRNMLINMATQLAGEDLTNNVLGVLMKPVVGSQYSSGLYQNFGSSVTANIKSTAGLLLSVMFTSQNAAVRYIQFFNTATTPSGGATPFLSIPIGAGTAAQPAALFLDSNFLAPGKYFSTGIAFAFSTTAATYTAATDTDHTLTVNYV